MCSISPTSWVITDRGKETTVRVDGQTKIIGDPKAGERLIAPIKRLGIMGCDHFSGECSVGQILSKLLADLGPVGRARPEMAVLLESIDLCIAARATQAEGLAAALR